MNRDLTPTEGVRLLLEREREDGTRGIYRVQVFTPATTFSGSAILDDDGSVALTLDAPADLVEMMTMVAKLMARGAAGRREDGMPPWPARILRWRGPGRGQ